jgi:hypothetical protein
LFRNHKTFFLLVLLCLPLLFINVKDSQDWGDDFAQYFLQARNIIEHRPQTDNGLVFDQTESESRTALKAYPVGFPLMLATVWKVHGHSIEAFSILISLLMIGFAALIFVYLKNFFSPLLSFIRVLAIIYNPVMLESKREVLSDIPFAFFLILSIQAQRWTRPCASWRASPSFAAPTRSICPQRSWLSSARTRPGSAHLANSPSPRPRPPWKPWIRRPAESSTG